VTVSGPPWPGYNGGKRFECDQCGTRFDTTAGIATHRVYGCDSQRIPGPVANKMPSCPACGSFALYRDRDGKLTCQTCTRSS
jgi:hypothetical protein